MEKMSSDEAFAEKIVTGKDKAERLAIAKTAGFDFTADQFKEMADNGEINIDRTLSYLAKTYESRKIRLFVRSGTGLFDLKKTIAGGFASKKPPAVCSSGFAPFYQRFLTGSLCRVFS